MKREKRHTKQVLSFNRRAVRASASVTRDRNAIHAMTEIDITEPRKLIREYAEQKGEKLSFTAYIVSCLAEVMKMHPEMNSFIKGNKLIVLKDLTISVLVERQLAGERVPEPFAIRSAQDKTFYQIHQEIREAQTHQSDKLGGFTGKSWFNLIPGFLLKTFIRIADKNIRMGEKYGKVAVTAVGMFCKEPVWFVPHGTATVLLTIGSISKKVVEIEGRIESREHLCLTVSFDHDIVDGAPASRFMEQLIESIKSGETLP